MIILESTVAVKVHAEYLQPHHHVGDDGEIEGALVYLSTRRMNPRVSTKKLIVRPSLATILSLVNS